MTQFIETKPASVKKISVIIEPTDARAGAADFEYCAVFSVFDYGTIHPPIPLDNSTVCLMTGFNFELLEEEGIDTHYFGLVNQGKLISAKEAIEQKLALTAMRVNYVPRLMPGFSQGVWDYASFKNPKIKKYVLPIEFIMRNALPAASSVWKRIQTGELTLSELGLPETMRQGEPIPVHRIPILDYSTKFEKEDRYLKSGEVQKILAMDDAAFAQLNATTKKINSIMAEYAAQQGFVREDGKIEYITLSNGHNRRIVLADAVCTWHEDRLLYDGFQISKQLIRNKIVEVSRAWYEEIQRAKLAAKEQHVANFKDLMNPDVSYISPSVEFFNAINTLFRAATNKWVDTVVYDVYPNKSESLADNLERAIEEFRNVE